MRDHERRLDQLLQDPHPPSNPQFSAWCETLPDDVLDWVEERWRELMAQNATHDEFQALLVETEVRSRAEWLRRWTSS